MELYPNLRKRRRIEDDSSIPAGELPELNFEDLPVKTIPPQNIVLKLHAREIWGDRRCGTEKYLARSMQLCICPNFTVTRVEKPACYLRKFTPDGRSFVAFSSDQMSVEVYDFKGPQAGTGLFSDEVSGDLSSKMCDGRTGFSMHKDLIAPTDTDCRSQYIRRSIFGAFFQRKFQVSVAPPGEQLNRECSLFTNDSRYLIVGSSSQTGEDIAPQFGEFYQTNESVDWNQRYPPEDYSIHLVDIKYGRLADTKSFKADKIFLSHNQGIYLYDDILAVLSVQHQTVHIFTLNGGKLIEIRTIGRFCYEDDSLFMSYVSYGNVRPFEEAFIGTLKHRLLVYIFKKAKKIYDEDGDRTALCRFFQYYEQVRKLRIWKMQLLDEDHLLLKYSNEEVVTLKSAEPNAQHCVFVVYEISTTEIVTVFENTSDQFVDLFENYSDWFRNCFVSIEARLASSPSNNIHAREIHQKFRQTFTTARYGGPVEATKRILAQLPISAQSYSGSPYLDQALFSYDDHRVSAMERPKACGEVPIKFYGRDSKLYKFQMHAGILAPNRSSSSSRRLVAFTFHPSAPFAISVQRANTEYLVNFHIRLNTNALCTETSDCEPSDNSSTKSEPSAED